MSLEVDLEEKEFDVLLADKRHKEVSGALKLIAKTLSKKSDSEVADAINKQVEKIDGLVKAIQNVHKPEKPEINVELNPKEFVNSVQQICKDIIDSNNKVIETIEKRLLPDTFDLIKNYGVTQSVKVNYKPANKITVKK